MIIISDIHIIELVIVVKNAASRCKAVSNCRSRSKFKRNKGPWDKMEKEEQYMKLIELRRVATQAKTELKLMKTKVARLERQAKKKDDQVETTLGKAAAAITAALSRDQDKDSNTIHDPSFVDTSNAKMVARLQKQVYSLLENLRKKEREMKEIKREKRDIKLRETLVELEEYKYEENQRLASKVREMEEMISKRTHLKSKRSGRKRLRQKKSGPTNRTNRNKSRMSKISKQNSSRINNVASNDNCPYLEKIIRSLQAIATERRVPYVTAVDDLRALLVVCEESMDTVGANTGHVTRNFNSKQADFTNSLISINGFLQSFKSFRSPNIKSRCSLFDKGA